MPKLSDEQIEQARDIDLLWYLQRYEPDTYRPSGRNEHCLVKHDSFKISNGKWHWHSQGLGGVGALDYLVKVKGIGFVDAVLFLVGGEAVSQSVSSVSAYKPKTREPPKPPKPPPPPIPFRSIATSN